MVEARAGVEPTYTDLQTRGLHRSAISKQKVASRWPPAALKPSSTPEFFTIEPCSSVGRKNVGQQWNHSGVEQKVSGQTDMFMQG